MNYKVQYNGLSEDQITKLKSLPITNKKVKRLLNKAVRVWSYKKIIISNHKLELIEGRVRYQNCDAGCCCLLGVVKMGISFDDRSQYKAVWSVAGLSKEEFISTHLIFDYIKEPFSVLEKEIAMIRDTVFGV